MSPLHSQKKRPSPIRFTAGQERNLTERSSAEGIPRSASAGSMTLEAAVIVPLFIFFFMNLMSSVEMLRLHGNVEAALWENGRIAAVSGYAYRSLTDDSGVLSGEQENFLLSLGGSLVADWALQAMVVGDLGKEYLDASPLTGGASGLNFLESTYMKDDCIDVKVTYKVSGMFAVPGVSSFSMANRYYVRAWTGYDVSGSNEDNDDEQYVYVTEHGTVYHVTMECTYLTRNIQSVSREQVGDMRNESGGRYSPCHICGNTITGSVVYVTSYGDRYHSSADCSELERSIFAIPLSEAVLKYNLCSKCG